MSASLPDHPREHSGNRVVSAMQFRAEGERESGDVAGSVRPGSSVLAAARRHRLTDENSVLQFLPHSGTGDSRYQTSTNVQNATTATQPDMTILRSSLSACLNHLRICALRKEFVAMIGRAGGLLRYILSTINPAR
jgi:hypothetical protein